MASSVIHHDLNIIVNSSNEKKWITPNADETIVENKGDGYDRVGFRIVVKSDTTVNNVLFKPMLRYASIADVTYVPYAKSNRELTDALAGFELATYEGTAPADTTDYKIESVRTVLGFKPSYFTILAAERYNTTNSVWYQMSNDVTATDYVIKAASDSNGVDYRVKFSDVTNYTKYRVVILYKR